MIGLIYGKPNILYFEICYGSKESGELDINKNAYDAYKDYSKTNFPSGKVYARKFIEAEVILKKKLGVDFIFSYCQNFNYDQKNYIYSLEFRNHF